jgi:hypothetical protein
LTSVCIPLSGKIFRSKKIQPPVGFYFFPSKKSSRGEEIFMPGFKRLDRLSLPRPRGGAPEGKRNGNYRHGARTKATIELWRLIKSLS